MKKYFLLLVTAVMLSGSCSCDVGSEGSTGQTEKLSDTPSGSPSVAPSVNSSESPSATVTPSVTPSESPSANSSLENNDFDSEIEVPYTVADSVQYLDVTEKGQDSIKEDTAPEIPQTFDVSVISVTPYMGCDYVGSRYEFTYEISNPREGEEVVVSENANWISGLVHEGRKVSFTVAKNNNAVSRQHDIIISYGNIAKEYVTVKQAGDRSLAKGLISRSSANCYIVSSMGSYTFPTVKGNSNEDVGAVASAEVLWESFGTDEVPSAGDLVSDVSYSGGYITFTTSGRKGNAVIAAKDASGNILWSWHIWLTDKPGEHIYNNNAGTMMDRNLGAISDIPGDVGSLGLLYQWGRKDPFLGGSSVSNEIPAKSTISWPAVVSSDATTGTTAYATANPTTFIKENDNNYDWYFSGDNTTTDNTRWQSSKTIYDPCPAGYRVPDGGDGGVWSTAFGTSTYFNEDAFDSSYRGFDLGGGVSTRNLSDVSPSCWYPAAGFLLYSDGSLRNVGSSGFYWSCSPSANYAYSLYFGSSGYIDPLSIYFRAYGRSVRCCRE